VHSFKPQKQHEPGLDSWNGNAKPTLANISDW